MPAFIAASTLLSVRSWMRPSSVISQSLVSGRRVRTAWTRRAISASESAVGVLEGTVTGYDRCSLDGEASVIKEDGTVSYAMAPVWILTTKFDGKPYTFMMNGQTGKVVGSVPVDKTKVLLYSIIPAILSIPIFYYIVKYMMSD